MSASDDRLSSAEVAHQAENARAGLAHTLDQLRDNLKPEHVVEEVVSNARIGASTMADQALQIARSYPLPAMLISLGATMIFGLGFRSAAKPQTGRIYEPVVTKPLLDRVQRDAADFGGADSQSVRAASASIPLPQRTRDPMSPSHKPFSDRQGRPVEPSRSSGVLNDQPMILAALGVAVGAAIGAVLPTTRIESDWKSQRGPSLKAAVDDVGRREFDDVSDIAARTAQAMRQTAAEHGMTADNVDGLVRDIGKEAKTAIDDIGARSTRGSH